MHIINRQCYTSYIKQASNVRQVVIVQEDRVKIIIYLAAYPYYALLCPSKHHLPSVRHHYMPLFT